jgi:hypothetical protein
MSLLSTWWNNVKGGKTDAQTIFNLIIAVLSSKQRIQLRKDLSAVSQAIMIAQLAEPNSTQVLLAKTWVDGALTILED